MIKLVECIKVISNQELHIIEYIKVISNKKTP